MAYIATQDLLDELGESRLVQLTDNEGTGELDEARALKAIQYAEGVFDAYLRSRYSVPVPSTPMVKAMNLDLAVFHLFKGRASETEGVYQIKKDAHDAAVKLLIAIGQGKAALDVPAAEETETTPSSGDTILTNANRSKFTDSALRDF